MGGPVLGLAVPAIAYLVAAALVLTIHVPRTVRSGAQPTAVRERLLDVLGGFRALARYPNAGLIVGLFLAQVVVRGALTVLLVSAAIELLGIGDNEMFDLGGLVGAILGVMLLLGLYRLALNNKEHPLAR